MNSKAARRFGTSLAPLLTLAAVSVFTAACAADHGSTSTESENNLLGAPIDTQHHWSVGVCAGPLSGGTTDDTGTCQQTGTRCTGTLVAPNLVLTARHCVRKKVEGPSFCEGTYGDEPLSDAPVRVTTSDSTLVGAPKWYKAKELLFGDTNASCADDVALVLLERYVPHTEASPIAMSLGRSFATTPPREVAIVGRGVVKEVLDLQKWTETFDEGNLKRRVLEHIPFGCATDSAPCPTVDFSSPPSNTFDSPPGYFVIGKGSASGDSGAGVLDQQSFNHRPRVSGVISAGTFGADGVPNNGLVTRLDTQRVFLIKGLIKAALTMGIPSEPLVAETND